MVIEHRYAARLRWSGSTGVGYDRYPREHEVVVAGESLRMSSDPHFGGDPASRNPEQLLVMAASSCQLLSFLAVAARARLDVLAYDDDAAGLMTQGDGPAWVELIQLRPRIELAAGSRTDQLQRLVEIAHRECFIARSLRSGMKIEATIVVEGQDVAVVRVADAAAPRVEPQRG
ncbi:OsmC family protein [Allobranchiibius huperziae]|uniref:Organic hydroperoxide reductase OsmC/OhrA n=1 Tax=Allobranchiibius huperziae TaxID=1874116 RepID=A0A853DH32_9MICO|nr:OsmC family protein [Allobranchiibius huperziae]NYJ76088.1 organic hydroperoxide reductase OsmC/OhrA [Allobranchiibius huperziae]